jgi:signal transduction histidine kinase
VTEHAPVHPRQRALEETGLLDSPPEDTVDRYTRLVTRLLGVPVSLISLVDDRRQFFKSQIGLGEPWASARETPLSHSFCLHVADTGAALVVDDAREDARVRGNLAIVDLDVVAYAGMPLRAPDGTTIGSLCAIDSRPRGWAPGELQVLQDLADAVSGEIATRVAAARQRAFVSSASHELRTPLTALRLRLEDLSLWPEIGRSAAEDLRDALAEIDRLSQRLSRLLQASRLDTLEDERVELADLVRDAEGRWRERAERCGRVLGVEVGPEAWVSAPAVAIRQILDVLIDNGLAHGQGGLVVQLSADDGHVRLRVRDKGPGIPRETATGLFRRGASGSGLALAAELTHTIGARLVLLPGAPTTFDLVLPIPR